MREYSGSQALGNGLNFHFCLLPHAFFFFPAAQ